MTSAEEYAKAFEDAAREAEEVRNRLPVSEALNLSQDIGPDLGYETRERLEQISQCGDSVAENIAKDALSHQQIVYDSRPNTFS